MSEPDIDPYEGPFAKVCEKVRATALAYPEAWEDTPWGQPAFKVKTKIFTSMGHYDDALTLSFKLPASAQEALLLPFTEPTGYGLGKHGWVSARFENPRAVPLTVLREWIDESYRAVATKTLVKRLDANE